jgi:hypothetical protein
LGRTIFYSWQSDRHPKEGRNLIEQALKTAVDRIAEDTTVEEAIREDLAVDKDTKGVPGSPPLFETILKKIDRASVFVADLTICGTRSNGRPTPNPNVLIEYGWALKSLGHYQIIGVMNAAHGAPGAASMVFDLAHIRFPITYNVPDDAPDSSRQLAREQLAKDLEGALKTVFASDEFKAKLPREPEPPEPLPFPRRNPMNGKARFRPRGNPLGFVRDILAQMVGSPQNNPVYLAEGPAMWLRMAPLYDPGKNWMVQELKQLSLTLAILPLVHLTGSVGFLQGDDGCGHWSIFDNEGRTYSIAYVFHSGEVWIINASLDRVPGYVELNEGDFTKTLDGCASFLDRLGCTKPYWWAVGIEGIQGRQLVIPSPSTRRFGQCLATNIENEGTYKKDDHATELLRPFFEKVFDQCGARRPTH